MSTDSAHRPPHGEIMVVEDNTSDLKFLSDILTQGGYRVRAAGDGELALRSVRAKVPDLILMDVRLPGMNGVEVCRRLKADPCTRDLPVIFTSALGETDLKVNALEAGGIDYVTKPMEGSEVLARIDTHLKMHRLRRELAIQAEELIAEIEERKQAEAATVARTAELERQTVELEKSRRAALSMMEEAEAARKVAEAAREELHQYEHIVSSTADMLALIDQRFVYLAANTAYLKAFSKAPNEVIGRTMAQVFGEEFFSTAIRPRAERCLAGENVRYDDWFEFPAAGRKYMDVVYSPYVAPDTKTRGFVVTARDITDRKQTEEERERLLHDMGERVKELECLHGLGASIRNRGTLEDMFQDAASLLPPGWHYPEITRGRIRFDGRDYVSEPFEETGWRQAADITVGGERRGFVEVCYLEQRPDLDEGPFLKEERNLIDSIAHALSEAAERKRAEEALQASEEKYRRLFAMESDAIMLFDAETRRFIDVNDAAVALYGYAREEFLSLRYSDITAEPDESDASIKATIAGELSKTPLCYQRKKDGTVFPVEVSASSFRLQGRQVLCSAIRDITERKQNEERLRQQQAELAHVSRLSTMGEMAAGFSHELNQPLSAILNYAEACRLAAQSAQGVPERIVSDLQEIATLATRAGHMIQRIKTFVRKREPALSSVDLLKTIGEVEKLLRSEMRLDNVAFRAEIDGDIRPIIGDEVQIQQVLLNLLRNAVDAVLETDHARHEVTIRVSAGGDGVVALSVCDNGAGLSPTISDCLFDAFVTTKPAGLGMGLSISRSIIEAHGGHLTASRNRERGMTFGFTLPAYNKGANHET